MHQRKVTDPCTKCGISGEVWLCLACGDVQCSRYVHGHMSTHNAESGHPLVLSFADFSFWCYICDSYVISEELLNHQKDSRPDSFYRQKFGDEGNDSLAVL